MGKYWPRVLFAASAVAVVVLHISTPRWFSLTGIAPCWEVLWLLPFALVYGPRPGCLSGLSLGLILDAMSLGDGTQVPVLVFLGFWWGQLGRRGAPIDKSLALGLLACIGTAFVGMGLWIQFFLLQSVDHALVFNSWSLHTLLAQVIITSLIAPLICSWLLLIFRPSNLLN